MVHLVEKGIFRFQENVWKKLMSIELSNQSVHVLINLIRGIFGVKSKGIFVLLLPQFMYFLSYVKTYG